MSDDRTDPIYQRESEVTAGELIDALQAAHADAEAARAEVREVTARAAAANRAKDDLLAMLNHELRNPLSTALAALEVLKLRGGATRELAVLECQVRQVSRLISDLLDVAQLTCGQIDLRRDPVDVTRVTSSAADAVRSAVEEHEQILTIDVDVRNGAPFVRGDEARLTQVLTSLLKNAVRFSPRGARIALTVERHVDSAVICVRDEGIGMSPAALGASFEPFVPLRESLGPPNGGLGLGLTIARLLTNASGGVLTASSDGPGAGSAFVLTLPLVAGEESDQGTCCDVPDS